MIENGNRLATWGLQLNTDIENWKNTKESMSFCTPSPVPVRLCCTQVMYMLHANCCQCTLENERDLSSFTIWRGSIIQLTSMHEFFLFLRIFQVVIVEPKVCIPSCPRPPPTKEEMEDWIRIAKVISLVQTCSQGLCSKNLGMGVPFVVRSNFNRNVRFNFAYFICSGSILSLVWILFAFVSNSLS